MGLPRYSDHPMQRLLGAPVPVKQGPSYARLQGPAISRLTGLLVLATWLGLG